MTFGKLIKQECKRQGVSHAELSRRLGVAQSRGQQIIVAKSISETLFRRCAKALGVKIEVTLVPVKGRGK